MRRHNSQDKWQTLYKVNHNWETGRLWLSNLNGVDNMLMACLYHRELQGGRAAAAY